MLPQKRYQNPYHSRDAARFEELRALRYTEEKRTSSWLLLAARFARSISDLFLLPARMNHSMCKNYGHVIHKFGRGRPRCGECGAVITNSSQMRGASLLETREGTGFEIIL